MAQSDTTQQPKSQWNELIRSEDWWAVWFGFIIIVFASCGLINAIPKIGKWATNPLEAISLSLVLQLLLLFIGFCVLTGVGSGVMGKSAVQYAPGFFVVFILTALGYLLGNQKQLHQWGLGYPLWALVIGMLIANTAGTPNWLLGGARSELFIKTGLVLLGAEILFQRMVTLGAPGLFVAWVVTPIVVLFMWWFGTRVLQITSKSLVIVIACATSVCGVSAAIASAAACRAKKEELTMVVGMTMIFTVGMMIGMPALCRAMSLDQYVGGAWIGGTVDSTGAVVAAGALFGEQAEQVAALVKMIQNMLIGIIAFLIALYWMYRVERETSISRPSAIEVWYRLPKFIVGFIGASLLFSFVLLPMFGQERIDEILKITKGLRGWWFALAFVSIGLESDFRQLVKQVAGGKPIWLYIIGQSFNVALTLLAAWLAFGGVLFDPPN